MISAILLTSVISAADPLVPSADGMTSAEWVRAARKIGLFNVQDGRQKREMDACETHLREITKKVVDFTKFESECTPWFEKMSDSTQAAFLCEHKCAAPFLQIVKLWGDDAKANQICSAAFEGNWDLFKTFGTMITKLACKKNPVSNKYCFDMIKEVSSIEDDNYLSKEKCTLLGEFGCCVNAVFVGVQNIPDLKTYLQGLGVQWPSSKEFSALKEDIKNECITHGAQSEIEKMLVDDQCTDAEVGTTIAESTMPYTDADGTEHNGGSEADSATSVTAGVAAAAFAIISYLL